VGGARVASLLKGKGGVGQEEEEGHTPEEEEGEWDHTLPLSCNAIEGLEVKASFRTQGGGSIGRESPAEVFPATLYLGCVLPLQCFADLLMFGRKRESLVFLDLQNTPMFLDLQDMLLPSDNGDHIAMSGTDAIYARPMTVVERFRSCFLPRTTPPPNRQASSTYTFGHSR
jgi:hypothetical protein